MPKNTFNSFKELLIKKDLSNDEGDKSVDFKVLAKIFLNLSKEAILSNAKHFDEAEQKTLKQFVKKTKALAETPSSQELESMVKEALKDWPSQNLIKFSELLESDADEAAAQAKKIEKLAKKYQPKDTTEELSDLQSRIKEIQLDIVDIEMNLMQMESDEQKNTERYKKTYNARERRMQIVQKLEKQIQGIEKKKSKKAKA